MAPLGQSRLKDIAVAVDERLPEGSEFVVIGRLPVTDGEPLEIFFNSNIPDRAKLMAFLELLVKELPNIIEPPKEE